MIANARIVEMPGCDLGAAQRPIGPMESHQRGRRLILRDPGVGFEEPAADGGLPEVLAFQREKGELIRGIHDPQIAGELQAVDDRRFRG